MSLSRVRPEGLSAAFRRWIALACVAGLCFSALGFNSGLARADDPTETPSAEEGARPGEGAAADAKAAVSPAVTTPTAISPTFTLRDLGITSVLSMYGTKGAADITIPVPGGLVPADLSATVELPVGIRAGMLIVMQKDRTIARVPLPKEDQTAIAIPLAGAKVVDNAVQLSLRASLEPDLDYCLDPNSPLRLVDGAVRFVGTEMPPKNVAEFLPPILRKLTVLIPKQPSKAESDSAIRLATSVVARYGQQRTTIALAPLESVQKPAGPFERQIVIRGSDRAGLSLEAVPGGLPNLAITGSDGEITNQIRLLSSDLARLALSSLAVAGPISDRPVFPADVTDLRRLGQPGVSSVALSPQAYIGFDQTALGRAVKSVRVHLKGSYSPIPRDLSAQLRVDVGGETIDSWPVDDVGRIDRWVDIPDRLLQRYTTIGVILDIIGITGRCGEFQPLTLTIDGSTVIQSARAAPPVPAGLQALPQAWMPQALVGIGSNVFEDTARATALAVAMQRLSVLPIDLSVTTVEEALRSKLPAIIVSADGWNHPDVVLPITADKGRLELDAFLTSTAQGQDNRTTLTVAPDLKYGALQTLWQGGRSLLVATSNNAPSQLDALLQWISADPKRFAELDGLAVVAAPGQESVVVGAQLKLAPRPENTGRPVWMVAAASLALAVAVAGILWLLRSRRMRRVGTGVN